MQPSPGGRQPTLLSSCARATTAAEARFRINAPAFTHRSSRVVALDLRAAAAVRDMARRRQPWGGGHFLVFESALPDDALLRRAPVAAAAGTAEAADAADAATALLSEELSGADTVVMVASAEDDSASRERAAAAAIIGDAAAARGIMSVGLVIPGDGPSHEAVAALRPNAMVLVVLREATDLPEVLTALRV